MTGVDAHRDAHPDVYPDQDPERAAAEVAQAFRDGFGHEPAGVWAAPGRVNVIGEHVDYNGGSCLPFALAHRTYVALAPRTDGELRVRSARGTAGGGSDGADGEDDWSGRLEDLAPGTVDGWAGYAVGVPWALREAGVEVPGFDALVGASVPLGAGLSSSAALECAVAVALDDVTGLGWGGDDAGRARLAAACVRAENDIAGAPTGGMDQTASLRSRAGSALLVDCEDFSVEHLPFDLPGAGLELLVIDTRAHHSLVDGQYGSRRQACEDAARLLGVQRLGRLRPADLDAALTRISDAVDDPEQADEIQRRVRHVVTEVARVGQVAALLRSGALERRGESEPAGAHSVGALLTASHVSLRDDYEVSCAELDVAVDAALAAGALGARMTGGGFGGSAIALLPAGTGGAVAREVTRAFSANGFAAAPAFLQAVPSGPAGRVR